MNENLNSRSERLGPQDPDPNPDPALAQRVLNVMAGTVVLAVVISLPFANWRVTTGLLLGGVLSLLNFHWMRNSIAAAFDQATAGTRPRIRMAQYVLRYFIIGTLVYAGYKLNVVSLAATVTGLSSFVIALFVEAFRASYHIIVHREGIN